MLQPGIIQSDEDDPKNKEVVRKMVLDFIRESRTIIVATVRWVGGSPARAKVARLAALAWPLPAAFAAGALEGDRSRIKWVHVQFHPCATCSTLPA